MYVILITSVSVYTLVVCSIMYLFTGVTILKKEAITTIFGQSESRIYMRFSPASLWGLKANVSSFGPITCIANWPGT